MKIVPMKKQAQSVTSLPMSAEQERHRRMIEYSIMMGVRVLCIVACIWVRGWWLLIPALGAIFLPYFAVVVANTAQAGAQGRVERPGAVVRKPDGR